MNQKTDGRVAWRVSEWAAAVGLSRAMTYKLLAAGSITRVKAGRATLIVTPPAEYLAQLAEKAAA